MTGSPPNCRPECYINSDCPSDKACISRKCQDPCPGLCGFNAYCRVRNHIPICVCDRGHIGDPFSQCYRVTSKYIFNDELKHIFFFLFMFLSCYFFSLKYLNSNHFSNNSQTRGHRSMPSFPLWNQCSLQRKEPGCQLYLPARLAGQPVHRVQA